MYMNTNFNKRVLNPAIAASLAVVVVFSLVQSAHASTPTLLLSSVGSGDSVMVNVNGDPNSSVVLNYLNNSGSVLLSIIGTTNSMGILSTTVSTSAYGITPDSLVNVTVNGQRSGSVNWPYSSASGTASAIALSQTNVTLSIGQSTTIIASNNGSNALYLSSNSNPAVANVSLNGSQITVMANVAGSTLITVCAVGNSSNCASFSVTVQGAAQTLLFSQNNLTITVGQTVPVTVAGGTGNYVITNNSNPGAIQTNVNGSTVNFYANTSSGSASVTVCSSDMSACGVINASAAAVTGSSVLSFSQTNPVIQAGQVTSVTVSGGSGNYYISSNSAPGVVQANIVNGVLTLFGNAIGSATINICSAGGGCGLMVATVNSASGALPLSLSQNNLSLSIGQTSNVAVSGGATPYNLGTNANNVFQASVSGNVVTVTGVGAGSSSVNICPSDGGQCVVLYVAVGGSGTSSGAITLTYILSVGQGLNLSISGGTAPYTLSSNSGGIFGANIISGNYLMLTGVAPGSSSVNVCSANGLCTPVYVTVVGGAAAQGTVSSATGNYKFYNPLVYGDKGDEVTELQNRLTAEGVYSGPVTGYFGSLTEAAVKKYQTMHGLTPLGNVGPGTRAELNK